MLHQLWFNFCRTLQTFQIENLLLILSGWQFRFLTGEWLFCHDCCYNPLPLWLHLSQVITFTTPSWCTTCTSFISITHICHFQATFHVCMYVPDTCCQDLEDNAISYILYLFSLILSFLTVRHQYLLEILHCSLPFLPCLSTCKKLFLCTWILSLSPFSALTMNCFADQWSSLLTFHIPLLYSYPHLM